METPAVALRKASARWAVDPLPELLPDSVPGLAFAKAMSSVTLRTGRLAFTTSAAV
jgi:hypothetical protein